MTVDIDALQAWVGRSQTREGVITAWPADALAATLDRDDPPLAEGDPIPPIWHWLYFPEVCKLAETDPDGHAPRGGFMPPVPLPRRMWAANRTRFERPLRVGERVVKLSTVTDVSMRTGRSGMLVFVTVRNEIRAGGEVATREEQTTVYREASSGSSPPARPKPVPAEALWRRRVEPSPVLLFRFSALTMNSHRIHYDREYATQQEGYPGLVVHGPLTVVLLLDLLRRERPAANLRAFAARAVAPIFDVAAFALEGTPADAGGMPRLWALNGEGDLAMELSTELEPGAPA